VPRTSASIAGRGQFRGIRILEELGQGKAEAGDEIVPVKLSRLGQDPCGGEVGIDVHLLHVGIHDPDETRAPTQVFDDLLDNLLGGISTR